METKKLSDLNDAELLKRKKKIKNDKITIAVFIGFTVGVAIYSGVKNGVEFFTFFPLLLAYIMVRNSPNSKLLEIEIEKELDSRNLK